MVFLVSETYLAEAAVTGYVDDKFVSHHKVKLRIEPNCVNLVIELDI